MTPLDPTFRLEGEILARDWFYEIELPSGRRTRSYLPPQTRPLHGSRLQILEELVDRRWPRREDRRELCCLDLACHEGFYSFAMARAGFGRVVGVDARPDHIEHARRLRECLGLGNVELEAGRIEDLDPSIWGRFDLVLALGVLYHSPHPWRLLERAAHLTQGTFCLETQLAPEAPETIEWGSHSALMTVHGCLALVDESGERSRENREASIFDLSLVPSERALRFLASRAGLGTLERLLPPPGAHEQLASGARAFFATTR